MSTLAKVAAGDTPMERGDDDDGAIHEDSGQKDRDTAYFQYYSLLSHQAQMLQDQIRTSGYQKAILRLAEKCFKDKLIIDVGAGNGILSIFSAQAGARSIFAIEASDMVERLQQFVDAAKGPHPVNAWLADKIIPISSKMEDVTSKMLNGAERVDTIVSECLGVLLVHERMCESFLDARDRFLKPGGTMLPSSGTICLAPFEDRLVWEEAANKARFWENKNFYGIDVQPFAEAAWQESFSSPVVGCFGPLIILTPSNDYNIDFQTISQEQLRSFIIPLSFTMTQTAVVHGLAGWFDLHFLPQFIDENSTELKVSSTGIDAGTDADVLAMSQLADLASSIDAATTAVDPTISSTYMSTSPFASSTHWQQVRFLLRDPLAINKGQKLVGTMHCQVNRFRSYNLTAALQIEGSNDEFCKRSAEWRLDRQVYSWTSAAPAPQ